MYFLSRLSSYDFRNQIDDCCLKCLSIDQREYKKFSSSMLHYEFFQVFQNTVLYELCVCSEIVHLDIFY